MRATKCDLLKVTFVVTIKRGALSNIQIGGNLGEKHSVEVCRRHGFLESSYHLQPRAPCGRDCGNLRYQSKRFIRDPGGSAATSIPTRRHCADSSSLQSSKRTGGDSVRERRRAADSRNTEFLPSTSYHFPALLNPRDNVLSSTARAE